MDKEFLLRHFKTECEEPVGKILGDDPAYKMVNYLFFTKSEDL